MISDSEHGVLDRCLRGGITATAAPSDSFDRYAIRLNETRESMKIVRQILDKMPSGDYRAQDTKVTPPPRARIDE